MLQRWLDGRIAIGRCNDFLHAAGDSWLQLTLAGALDLILAQLGLLGP
jgi:hypothetical protein